MTDNWIATTSSKQLYDLPDFKPSGMWQCLACETVQHGSTLIKDPQRTGIVWTCSNVFCGGACVKATSAAKE